MGVPAADLARANPVDPDDRPAPGPMLRRPHPAGSPRSKPVHQKPVRAASPYKTTAKSAKAGVTPIEELPALPVKREQIPAHPLAGTPHLVWPTSGAVVTRFSARVHGLPANGIDLAAFSGMTVRAAAAGQIVFAGTEPERFGQLIVIDHGNGWATAYAYLGK
eukprot:gene25827-32314_t